MVIQAQLININFYVLGSNMSTLSYTLINGYNVSVSIRLESKEVTVSLPGINFNR